MKKRLLVIGMLAAAVVLIVIVGHHLLQGTNIAVFNPKGTIAAQQRTLIFTALLLSTIVVVPVFGMTFWFAWRYRETNPKAKKSHRPDWDHSVFAETMWWGIPLLLISVLGVITWTSTHKLDPFKPISSTHKTLHVQVVALQWKWLFIYPDQRIATVNALHIPVNTPVDFEITSDAPMNSFWIPQLGGQIYAMSGMATHLHLMADTAGSYRGSSANLSGAGFAGMNFQAIATPEVEFDSWVTSVRDSGNRLSPKRYDALAKPSQNSQLTYYGTVQRNLFNRIIMKYMMPGDGTIASQSQEASL